MTKAERIFKETRYQCSHNIKIYGYKEIGFNNVCVRESKDNSISKRTLNDLDRIYEEAVKKLVADYKIGAIGKEKAYAEAQVLRKVRLTLDNARHAIS